MGLITYQYLRMMGDLDAAMPDKIVKRMLNEMFKKTSLKPIEDDLKFVEGVERIAKELGYRALLDDVIHGFKSELLSFNVND